MRFCKLRIAWSVIWGTACLVLTAACFTFLYRNSNVDLMRRGGPGPTVLRIDEGEVSLSWEPRSPYRPKWAGQSWHCGFRYNVYSNGSWWVSGPLWAVGAFLVAALATFAASSWLTWRFSLRTLLIVTTLAGLMLGLSVWAMQSPSE
jgi:hypothetical protein